MWCCCNPRIFAFEPLSLRERGWGEGAFDFVVALKLLGPHKAVAAELLLRRRYYFCA